MIWTETDGGGPEFGAFHGLSSCVLIVFSNFQPMRIEAKQTVVLGWTAAFFVVSPLLTQKIANNLVHAAGGGGRCKIKPNVATK
jgi:hypothetical protein